MKLVFVALYIIGQTPSPALTPSNFTHHIMSESLSSAPINQNTSILVNFCQIHGRTLHLGIRKRELNVDIIHIF